MERVALLMEAILRIFAYKWSYSQDECGEINSYEYGYICLITDDLHLLRNVEKVPQPNFQNLPITKLFLPFSTNFCTLEKI